jgi:peptidyl-prolyl cis-trans isomerase A (cyclophilin A)
MTAIVKLDILRALQINDRRSFVYMKKFKSVLIAGVVAMTVPVLLSAKEKGKDMPMPSSKQAPGTYARFETSEGNFLIKLFPEDAPKTVENFVGLAEGTKEFVDPKTNTPAKRPFYDGLTFHRLIPDFMIQGGDPKGTGTGGPGYRFEDEFKPNRSFDKPGILAMANSGPNTNGSQFFITVAKTPWLDQHHTIFGEVVEGYDVVEKISLLRTTPGNNMPLTPVTMKAVKIERVK